jgi:hypothetical protein
MCTIYKNIISLLFFVYMYEEHYPFRWQANLPARNFRQDDDDDEGDEMT